MTTRFRDGQGTCATCGGPCDKRAQRCRTCTREAPELVCPRCRQRLPRAEFITPAGNRNTYCPPCSAEWHRVNRWLRKYGMTANQYEALMVAQDGRCAICGTEDEGRGYGFLHVDHDHVTGKVRGLLCFACNSGIGNLGDSADRLRTAAAYLDAHR